MSKNESPSWPDKLYRTVLILAAAVIFGVLFYWVAPDVSPYVGENGAALWSWTLIVFSGIVAHRILPKKTLAPVSRVLFALFLSSVAAMLSAWISMLVVDAPVDQGELPQVLVLVALLALVFASIVFLPLYLLRKKLGRAVAVTYLIAGTIIPASCVMAWRPVDQNDVVANVILAVFLGVIGGCSAISFAFATTRFRIAPAAKP